MNVISRGFVFIGVLLFSINAFAAYDFICPTVPALRNVQFVKAISTDNRTWRMISDAFSHKKNKWNVFFTITFPEPIASSEEAMKLGQLFYSSKVKFTGPVVVGDSSLPPTNDYPLICLYDDGARHYGVFAQSPPLIRF